MRKIWLPPRLYSLLPVAYLLSGLLMLANFGSEPFGLISGAMLCGAAAVIWVLRIHAASKTNAPKR
jgi:F0F1-type ATP synthase assembly protein I